MPKRRKANRMSDEHWQLQQAIVEHKKWWKSLTPEKREEIKLARREKKKEAHRREMAENDARLKLERQKLSEQRAIAAKERAADKRKEKSIKAKVIEVIKPVRPEPVINYLPSDRIAIQLDSKTTIYLKPGADAEQVKNRSLNRNSNYDSLKL